MAGHLQFARPRLRRRFVVLNPDNRNDYGYIRKRPKNINDVPIEEGERRILGPRGPEEQGRNPPPATPAATPAGLRRREWNADFNTTKRLDRVDSNPALSDDANDRGASFMWRAQAQPGPREYHARGYDNRPETLLNATCEETPMRTKVTSTKSVRTKTADRLRAESRARDSRPGAVPNLEMVNVFEEALSAPGGLLTKAWVRNVAYDKKVWLDVDLIGWAGEPLHSQTFPLQYVEPAGGAGDFFLADFPVPPAARMARRASASELRYRLYYEVEGQVFTDGFCHSHRL